MRGICNNRRLARHLRNTNTFVIVKRITVDARPSTLGGRVTNRNDVSGSLPLPVGAFCRLAALAGESSLVLQAILPDVLRSLNEMKNRFVRPRGPCSLSCIVRKSQKGNCVQNHDAEVYKILFPRTAFTQLFTSHLAIVHRHCTAFYFTSCSPC